MNTHPSWSQDQLDPSIDLTGVIESLKPLTREFLLKLDSFGLHDDVNPGSAALQSLLVEEAAAVMDWSPEYVQARIDVLVMQHILVVSKHGAEDEPEYILTKLGAAIVAQLVNPQPVKPLTRAQCLVALGQLGYKGPVSYPMPDLRRIVEQEKHRVQH